MKNFLSATNVAPTWLAAAISLIQHRPCSKTGSASSANDFMNKVIYFCLTWKSMSRLSWTEIRRQVLSHLYCYNSWSNKYGKGFNKVKMSSENRIIVHYIVYIVGIFLLVMQMGFTLKKRINFKFESLNTKGDHTWTGLNESMFQLYEDYGVRMTLHHQDHGIATAGLDYRVLEPETKTTVKVKWEQVHYWHIYSFKVDLCFYFILNETDTFMGGGYEGGGGWEWGWVEVCISFRVCILHNQKCTST